MGQQHTPPAFVRCPDELLAAFLEAERRMPRADAAEQAAIFAQASSIATAYLMGLGVDTKRWGYRIDLALGGLTLVGRRPMRLALVPRATDPAADDAADASGDPRESTAAAATN